MILVTGSTGHYGRLVIDQLLGSTDPSEIVAGARRPEALQELAGVGVEVRHLDYNLPGTIAAALTGVTQVLLVSSSEIGARLPQHAAVIDAAVAAGVEHLAYTSLLRADTATMLAARDHRATEELLAVAAIPTTRLRNGWYIENYTEQLAPALANGAFVGSAGNGRIAAATRADYAAAAVAVLSDSSRWGGTFELAGTGFTMSELAAAVSAHAGRDLPYVDMAPDDLAGILAGAGVPAPFVEFLVSADLGIAAGELDAPSDTLSELIGRPPTTLGEVLSELTWT